MRPTAPCFGSRFKSDGAVGPFNWQSYEQVHLPAQPLRSPSSRALRRCCTDIFSMRRWCCARHVAPFTS